MADQFSEWLVVNEVAVEAESVTVGATNRERWEWDRNEGYSGADAKTIISVRLIGRGPGYAVGEEMSLFCARDDPLRPLALQGIGPLLALAWQIREQDLDDDQARAAFFGRELK